MTVYDWGIIVVFVLTLTAIAVSTKRYTKSVADFLAANRCAGRYLIAAADGMVAFGLSSVVVFFEMYYKAGFTAQWWMFGLAPITVIVYITGWVVYRFRQTRSLTLLQFFEQRYSKNFRIFVGILSFFVCVVTMGIAPAIGARFFIYSCGLPDSFSVLSFQLSTFPVVTAVLLSISLFFTFIGGHIAILVTDFLQGMLSNIVLLALMIVLLLLVPWQTVMEGLSYAPENASMINPFKTSQTQTYDVWFFLIWGFNTIYMFPAWQGTQAYSSAAKNPHEARMARVLGNIRGIVLYSAVLLLPIIAYAILHHPDFVDISGSVNERLADISSDYYRKQVTVPLTISKLIPAGLFGLFLSAMLGALISTTDTLLHAYGSIFIQDVILPFRKKPFSRKTHMLLLRLAICGVAVFIYGFSLWYKQTQDIWLFYAILSSFYYGGAGAALVFGLYWKRGTTASAWAAMITGMVLTGICFSIQKVAPQILIEMEQKLQIKTLDSQRLAFFIMVISAAVYIVVSLLSKKGQCNMDKLFHRGQYAIEDDKSTDYEPPMKGLKALGINKQFSKSDRLIYFVIIINTAISVIAFIVITILNFVMNLGTKFWSVFWQIYVWNIIISGSIVTVWFLIGGSLNLRYMFRFLSTARRNDLDDGMVVDHQNLDEKK